MQKINNMSKGSGTTKSVGASATKAPVVSYGSGWSKRESSYIGEVNEYKNDKVEVEVTKSGGDYRVQAMELPSITPKGQALKSDVQYFPTEQQAKSFADNFIKTAEAKTIIKKEKKLPFVTKKTGKIDGF